MEFLILLITTASSCLLGGVLFKHTIDEVKGKEWALSIIISLFCFLISFLTFLNIIDYVNFLIGYVTAFAIILIASRFSKPGFIDYSILSGALLGWAAQLKVIGLIIMTALAIQFIPVGTLISLNYPKKWVKKLLYLIGYLTITAIAFFLILNQYNYSLLSGVIGGLMLGYGVFYAIKGKR